MPKQDFDLVDYMAAPIAVVSFLFSLFVICIIINFTLITKNDDLTKFERLGSKVNLRLGPHSMAVIRRGGYVSTLAKEESIAK